MRLWESIRMALRSILVNKLRSFLTMLGIIIGVSTVIAMVAIGQGASQSVSSQIQGLGSNLLIVSPGQASQGGVKLGAGSLNTLTLADVEEIAKQPSVSGVAPSLSKQLQVVYHNSNVQTTIEGTTPAYEQVRTAKIQAGRFFTSYEVKGTSNVAVIGSTVVTNLFSGSVQNALGKQIQIGQLPFTVIGVLESQGSSGATNNDDRILVPITTAMNRLFGDTKVRTIYVSAKSSEQMVQAQFETQNALRSKHNLKPKAENDFQISSQEQILTAAKGITDTMTALLSGIAGISLLVGGIGIMNIMLVSVTERTREIGIRKAIGATRGAVMTQFLIESITLSIIGGVLGILLGVGFALLLPHYLPLSTAVTLSPILYAFGFSILVGVIFGGYPARKASRLNPIDALRYE